MVSASTSRPAPASAPRIALSRPSRSQYPAVTAPPRARAGTGRRDDASLATNSLTGVKPSSTCAPGYSEVGEKMVGRDGIEPPTPGFSDRPAAARKYAEVLYLGDLARRRSLVLIGSRWSIADTRGHRTGTPS